MNNFLCNGCGAELAIDGTEKNGGATYDCFDIWHAEAAQITQQIQKAIKKAQPQQNDVAAFLTAIHERNPKYFSSPLKVESDGKGDQSKTTVRRLTGAGLLEMAEEGKKYNDAKQVIDCLLANKDSIRNLILVPEKHISVKTSMGVITVLYSRNATGQTTAYPAVRRCPQCGARIYGKAGMYPEICIGVVGAPRQGKSALLTSVVNAFSGNGKCGITIDKDSTDPMYKVFERNCLDRFCANIKIRKTEETETLAYRFTANLDHHKFNLLFIDIAGELLQQGKEAEFTQKYGSFMDNADCFWLCTDDFQIHQLDQATADYGLGAVVDVGGIQMDNGQLENMLSLLTGERKNIPCAVTIVKSDTLETQDLSFLYKEVTKNPDNGPEKGLYGISKTNDGYALDEIAVNKLCRNTKKYIGKNNPAMLQVYENCLEECGFMACSAYGHAVADFNVAFNDNEMFLYVPDTMKDTLLQEGKSFDIEVHEGNLITTETERRAIKNNMRFTNCTVEHVQLRRNIAVKTSGVYGIRIPGVPKDDQGMPTDEMVLRILSCKADRSKNAHWDDGESESPEFFIRRLKKGEGETVYIVTGNTEVRYQVIDKPAPDQVELLLLWTLAMRGNFPTIGKEEVAQSWLQKLLKKEPELKKKKFPCNDSQSRKIICGGDYPYHRAH